MGTPIDTMLLNRDVFTENSTTSNVWIDCEWMCYALEPTCRKGAPGIHAIPQGKYELVMYESPHFKMRVPLLLKVPGHDYVEIHPGNCPKDTHDCILPGQGRAMDWISNSDKAFARLVAKIEEKLNAGKYYIGISGGA